MYANLGSMCEGHLQPNPKVIRRCEVAQIPNRRHLCLTVQVPPLSLNGGTEDGSRMVRKLLAESFAWIQGMLVPDPPSSGSIEKPHIETAATTV